MTVTPHSDRRRFPGSNDHRHVWLRLLETTDVHANLLPYDYFAGRNEKHFGLARTATLIRQARMAAVNCLLFDNGDFLQGTPLGDMAARPVAGWQGVNPVIAAMNGLGYDAVALGNHEFNFGLEELRDALAGAAFPVLCANAVTRMAAGPEDDDRLYPGYIVLDRAVTDSLGAVHDLRIGVIGLVPPQITIWDQFHLQDRVAARDMVECARALVPVIRGQGADLVVLLAHTGIDTSPPTPGMENAALPLAGIDGVDAILTGHTHQVFPQPGAMSGRGVDNDNGTLAAVPAVMAGFRGSHLGLIDLKLEQVEGRWRVTGHRSEAQPVSHSRSAPPVAADPALSALAAPAHARTLELTRQPIGHSRAALHSYLAQIRCDSTVQVVTRAKAAELVRQLAGGPHEGVPVLAASAPFKTGGRAGPCYYTDIPAGPLSLRNAADLYPFPNTLCGVMLSGAEIADWLERAASGFNRIVPGQAGQALCDPRFPGHAIDTIYGLRYRIDLTAPARYGPDGSVVAPGAARIRGLRHGGRAVEAGGWYVLAVNNYRAFGGGPYPRLPRDRFVFVSHVAVQDVVVQFLRDGGLAGAPEAACWAFEQVPGTVAEFETGPGIRSYSKEMADLGIEELGETEAGFLRLSVPL